MKIDNKRFYMKNEELKDEIIYEGVFYDGDIVVGGGTIE